MSDSGDGSFDMTADRRLTDADLDRAIRGHAPSDRPELAAASSFAAAVAALGDDLPEPRGALAMLLAEGFDPATSAPAAAGRHAVPHRSRWAGLRRPAARVAGLSLAAQVLTGTGVALAAVTGAAGTGVLPAPVQDRVGGVLERVTPFKFPTSETPASPAIVTPESDDPTEPAVRPTSPTVVERPAPERPPMPPREPAIVPPEAPAPTAEPTPSPSPTDPELTTPPAPTPTPTPTPTPILPLEPKPPGTGSDPDDPNNPESPEPSPTDDPASPSPSPSPSPGGEGEPDDPDAQDEPEPDSGDSGRGGPVAGPTRPPRGAQQNDGATSET